MSNLWSWFQANWRTNLIATAAIVYSAREFTLAITAWVNHQPENWRAAIISLLVAAVGYVAKDAANTPTQSQVDKATLKAAQK